ncbi:protein of unknown function [Pararobbsia alpina]
MRAQQFACRRLRPRASRCAPTDTAQRAPPSGHETVYAYARDFTVQPAHSLLGMCRLRAHYLLIARSLPLHHRFDIASRVPRCPLKVPFFAYA